MDTMKSSGLKIVKWMVAFGVIAIVIGSFLPFVGWDLFGSSEYYNFYMVVEDTDEYVWGGIMIVALLISGVSGIVIDVSMKLGPAIWMGIAAIIGEIGFRYYVSELDYFFFRFGIGKGMMEVAYIVLIVVSFIASIIKIHYRSNGGDNKEIINSGYKCPKCGIVLYEKSKFCSGCGFDLKSFVCPNCGSEIDCDSQFCKECGHRLPVVNMKKIGND